MQISITFLSIVLSLSTISFGLPSNSTRFGLIGNELHEEEPKSDLQTLGVESSTQSPTRRRTTGSSSYTFTRVHTVVETIRTTFKITAATEDSSMCLHTHSMNGAEMIHTRPCALTGLPPAPPSTISAAAEVSMCVDTHTQNGTAFLTHTIPCSLTDRSYGHQVVTEKPFSHVLCRTCDTVTSTMTFVENDLTSLATTTLTINPDCPDCFLANMTYTDRGVDNTITYTTEQWQQSSVAWNPDALPVTTVAIPLPMLSKTVYITRRSEPTSSSESV
ncbi:hypothetical protein WAI453_004597 [Rhynchosporium graminicola]